MGFYSNEKKIHLKSGDQVWRDKAPEIRTACGRDERDSEFVTQDPDEVTCGNCKYTQEFEEVKETKKLGEAMWSHQNKNRSLMKFNKGQQVYISDGYYKGILARIKKVGKKHYKADVIEDPYNNSDWSKIIIDDKYLKRKYAMREKPEGKSEFIEEEQSATDKQVGGSHYKDFNIQPVEFVLKNENHLHPTDSFLLNNVLKYCIRHRRKGGIDDLKKAKHYIDMVIEHEYE